MLPGRQDVASPDVVVAQFTDPEVAPAAVPVVQRSQGTQYGNSVRLIPKMNRARNITVK